VTAPIKTCFVISPIGEKGSATRTRADLVFEFVIQKALNTTFEIERADRLSEPGLITNQIIDRVINADLVIADLSERNPNVFYELAIRHIARKPYIHIIAHDEDIPFDNAGVRAIKVDVQDLRSVEDATNELRAQVESAMSGKIESPISIAINLQEIKSSGDEDKIALSALINQVSFMNSRISEIRNFISNDFYLRNRNNANSLIERYASAEIDYSAGAENALAPSNSMTAAVNANQMSNLAVREMRKLERFNSEMAEKSGISGSSKRKPKFQRGGL
jgi:hypothetical protein